MTHPVTEITPEFWRGWDAALMAARTWHEFSGEESDDAGKTQQVPREFQARSRGPPEVRRDDHNPEPRRRLTAGSSPVTVGSLPVTSGDRLVQ